SVVEVEAFEFLPEFEGGAVEGEFADEADGGAIAEDEASVDVEGATVGGEGWVGDVESGGAAGGVGGEAAEVPGAVGGEGAAFPDVEVVAPVDLAGGGVHHGGFGRELSFWIHADFVGFEVGDGEGLRGVESAGGGESAAQPEEASVVGEAWMGVV